MRFPNPGDLKLGGGDALLIVDAQNDFLPGGRLGVPRGDEIVPVLNKYLDVFRGRGLPVFATCDRHPPDHCSFREQGGPWPSHCVAGTEGAEFAAGLALPPSVSTVAKAMDPGKDAYSGFEGTDLDDRLRSAGVKRVFVGGLATDYCVLNTVRDAVKLGYAAVLLEDAVRAVNLDPDDGRKAMEEMVRLGARPCVLERLRPACPEASPLLVDLYQLAMLQGYFDRRMEDIAVFEFFVRRLPPNRAFLMAAGLEQVLEFLETLRFSSAELAWLESCGRFTKDFPRQLEGFRFTGDAHAMPEGTVFFANEPILRIAAPLPQAQFLETRIINLLQFQTLIASKAARSVLAAPGKLLVDFGLRRAHGAEAGLLAARASYLAGFDGTATTLAGPLYGVPTFGTMAHSFVQAHDDEAEAFENFALSQPENVILLLDTYDTERAAAKVVSLSRVLKKKGIAVQGVRLDSGDLDRHARDVRRILDAGGLREVRIFASGNLDEYALREFMEKGSPADGFGIGSRLTTSADAPYLDCVYKLVEYAGRPRRKLSEAKDTWPGGKQVFRRYEDGRMKEDTVALEGEPVEGEPLLQAFMRGGRRRRPPDSVADIRRRAGDQLRKLPGYLRGLDATSPYPVAISQGIERLARAIDARLKNPADGGESA
ncbi:MAG: nicotinate phosphoribosyltransferase [Nitrospinae bacterium]|nr:nicotinate phosphoribosyltransferase [Nitrospinota bacterium]